MLGDDGMHFRFGFAFNRTVPYELVAAVFPRSWPLLNGSWRSNLRGVLGLTGSYHDVVEVRLQKRIDNWAGVFPVDRIAVSLEEPEAFIEELSRRAGLAEPKDVSALAKPRRSPQRPKRVADRRGQAANAAAPPKPTAAKRAPAAANGQTKPQASAPAKTPAKKAAAPKQAVRKAAPSRTAVRARRSRS